MSATDTLDRLAAQAGIEPDYYDIWGTRHALSAENKRELLRAMGFAVETEDETARSLFSFDQVSWQQALEPVEVIAAEDGAPTISIRLSADRANRPLDWWIATEDGAELSGRINPRDMLLRETGRFDGHDVERRLLPIPASLTPGYHRIGVDGDGLRDLSRLESVLIVSPQQAFLPEGLAQGPGSWGFAVQVYALQGRGSWGMGDFSDLAGFAQATAAAGAGVLGVNPLHALFPGNPAQASPYSPSSRSFLNTLYIDVAAVPDFADSDELNAVSGANFNALRQAALVDYRGVAALKQAAFERLYQSFVANHMVQGTARAEAFEAFLRDGDTSLEQFAIFSVLDEHFRNQSPNHQRWRDWPAVYRDPTSQAVATFAVAHRDRVRFHQYLQWEAERQLGVAASMCRKRDMPVGLYRDLAVGVDPNGADVWAGQKFFADGISTGAPPDPFNLKGQSWGLPPFRPRELRAAAYRPFIEAIRANMRHAGALRIDHVMGLMRLFWVPASADATQGGYVRYPLDDLIAIATLESQRARCVVVGEDLGTVPEGLRERLGSANIFSTRLLYFERDGTEFRPAHVYPKLSQVSIRTQDLPTFSSFWNESDITLSTALNLLPSAENEEQLRQERSQLKQGLLAILHRVGLDAGGAEDDPPALAAALYRFLCSSPARLIMVYLEDLLGTVTQTNLPGTVDEYPNWRAKLPNDWQTLLANPSIQMFMRRLATDRPRSHGK